MNRDQIPGAILKARRSDCDRIPGRVLAKLTLGGLVARLSAAAEFRRRAGMPHLDGELLRYRTGLASEVLVTADAKRAAQLVKSAGVSATAEQSAAGVPAWTHRPFSGSHSHEHAAWSAPDAGRDGGHEHSHEHRGDSNHHHVHAHAAASAKSAMPATSLARTEFPGVDSLIAKATAARSVATALIDMANGGELGALERDIRALRQVTTSGGQLVKAPPSAAQRQAAAKAADYRRKASVVSDPAMRAGYVALAKALETA